MKGKLTTIFFLFAVLILAFSPLAGCQPAPTEITKTATQTVSSPAITTTLPPTTITTPPTTIIAPPVTVTKTLEPETRDPRTLRIEGPNLGWPQPYTGSTQGRAYLYMSLIFDTLTWKDQTGVLPLLAKSWTVSTDQKTWTMTLVENAKFSDGTPLTAQDVKFTFDYMQEYPNKWVQLGMVDSVSVVDTYTVQIALTSPYAPFLTDVAGLVPILPQHIWADQTEPSTFTDSSSVIGSGPYTLKSFDSATGVYIFTANNEYFLGVPEVDTLIYAPDSNPYQSLLNGDIDVGQNVSYQDSQRLKMNPDYKVLEGPGLFIARVYFNFDIPELNDVNLRQAMYSAINRTDIIQKALSNGGVPGNPGYVAPDSMWYNPDVAQYSYDVAQAKQILDDNNIKDTNGDGIREINGVKLEYELLTTGSRLGEAQLIANYWEQIGVKVTIQTVDQSTLNAHIQGGTFDLALNGHGSMGGDPVMLSNFVSPDVTVGTSPVVTRQGGTPWTNAEFDRIFVEQLQEMDPLARQDLVNQLQVILAEELPTLPIYYLKISVSWNPETLNGWFFTEGGTGPSVPTAQNKLVFIHGWWGQ